jgi:hypothetical protein
MKTLSQNLHVNLHCHKINFHWHTLIFTMQLLSCLALFAAATVGHAALLRGQGRGGKTLESSTLSPYYSTSDPNLLGSLNPDAAVGNPLKGLVASPSWTGGNTKYTIPNSLEFTYVGMNSVMKGDNQFNWTKLDKTLTDAASRNNHVIWRIYVDYAQRWRRFSTIR